MPVVPSRRNPRNVPAPPLLGSILLAGTGLLASWSAQADSTAGGTAGNQTAQTAQTAATPAPAQVSRLGKVVVTSKPAVQVLKAQKDVPSSVTVVSGEELQQQDALNIEDILKRVGNVQWNFGNQRNSSLSIRGIAANGQDFYIDPSLGMVVDGVPYVYTPLITQLDFVDVSSISVQRGPQGSTGGTNTSVGTMTVNNNQPTFAPEAQASLILGQLNAVVAQAAVGGPVIDNLLAWRGTFYRDEQQGPYNNSYQGDVDRYSWDNTDRTLGRVQFLLTPTDNFNALLSVTSKPKGIEFTNGLTQEEQEPAYYADGKATYVANGLTGATNTVENKLTRGYFTAVDPLAYQNYLNDPVLEATDQGIETAENGGVLKLNWELPWATVSSITGYESALFEASDGTTEWDIDPDSGTYSHYRQESEEIDLTSQPGGFVDYKTGLFYLQSSSDDDERSLYGADAGDYEANAAQYAAATAVTGGQALLQNSLDDLYNQAVTWTENRTAAAFGQLNWHLSDPLTATTGLRLTREDRQTSQDATVTNDGLGALLDPTAFSINSTTGVLGTNTAQQLANANAVAQQYFGVSSYSSLTAAQQAAVAAAKGVRSTTGYSNLYSTIAAQPYRGTLPTGNIALSYKFDPQLTGYVTWEHGAKAGISQVVIFNGAATSMLVAPESSNAYETGLKGAYFKNTLTVNADVFLDDLRNFQQSVGVYNALLSNEAGTATYTTATGNAPLVRITGLEVDAAYTGIRNLTLRFAGDYNNAFYKSTIFLAQPVERGDLTNATTYDAKGQTLPNAPHFTGNLSGEYAIALNRAAVFHTDFNYHYTGQSNDDPSQSEYAWIKGYGLADFGVGIGRADRKFDVTLLLKNAFNTSYNVSQTWDSYIPGLPRWIGVRFSSTL